MFRVRGQNTGLPRVPDDVVLADELRSRLSGSRGIVLLRAPEGFGKTTVLAAWLREVADRHTAATLLRVDRSDGSATTFWGELAARLADAGLGEDSPSSPRAAVHRAVRSAPGTVLLVIDSFDRITDAGVDEDLIDLLRDAPNLRLVVALRTAHHFERRLWRDIDGDEITAADLALSPQQLAAILARHDVVLAPDEAEQLHHAVGGWPKAVRALVAQIGAGPDVDIAAAVAAARDDLRRSAVALFGERWLDDAVLPSAVPDSCGPEEFRVMGLPSGARRALDELVTEGLLFAAGSNGGRTYTWPTSTRELLLEEFAQRRPARLRALHRRLARHYAHAGDTAARALTHAAQGADWPEAVRIVERWWAYLWLTDAESMRRSLADAPIELFTSAVALAAREMAHPSPERREILLKVALPASTEALIKLARGRDVGQVVDAGVVVGIALRWHQLLAEASAHFERLVFVVEQARGAKADQIADRRPGVYLHSAITRLVAGDFAGAAMLAESAYQRGGESRFDYTRRDAATKIAVAEAIRGEARSAAEWLLRSDHAAQTNMAVRDIIEVNRNAARALSAAHSLDQDAALAALAGVRVMPEDELWVFALYAQSTVALLWGDCVGTLRRVRERRAEPLNSGGSELAGTLLLAAEVDLRMGLGSASRAAALLAESTATAPWVAVRRARLALYAGDCDTAAEQARAALTADDAPADVDVEALLIEALVAYRTGAAQPARSLELAAHRAESSGCLRPFTLLPRGDLIAIAASVPAARAVLDRPEVRDLGPVFDDQLQIVALTARERSVLSALAAGRTLPEIARTNFVSINTVKTQLRRLYRKLGATDRDEALRRAREAGIL